MIIQTTGSSPSQALQPDVRISGGAPVRAPVAPASGRPASPPPSAGELKVAVDALNKMMQQSNHALEFSVDTDTHATVVRMVDTTTGELLRQFPSEAALSISRNIAEFQQGQLLQKEA
jgi:flagellar protein FlaG